MQVNLYDFDKTIYDGDSTIDFYLFCLKKKLSIIQYLPLFIILFATIGTGLLSFIGVASLTSSKESLIITAQVIEQVNCVGGKRIYLNDINIPNNDPRFFKDKYFVYFSNNTEKFTIGKLLNFDLYKYGEAFTREAYRNVSARVIYNYKEEDFNEVAINKR